MPKQKTIPELKAEIADNERQLKGSPCTPGSDCKQAPAAAPAESRGSAEE